MAHVFSMRSKILECFVFTFFLHLGYYTVCKCYGGFQSRKIIDKNSQEFKLYCFNNICITIFLFHKCKRSLIKHYIKTHTTPLLQWLLGCCLSVEEDESQDAPFCWLFPNDPLVAISGAPSGGGGGLRYFSAGPQTRTVPSSEAETRTRGKTGFQVTQLTVREWPLKTAEK